MKARDSKSPSFDLTISRSRELTSSGLRLDKWLWFARFFKSRSLATDAVAGGRVHVNGERVKPAHEVRIGDSLQISRDQTRLEAIVRGLPVRRGPAAEAQLAYEETADSKLRRERHREQMRLSPPAPQGRPDKHARRELRSLRGRQ